jgi:hypothetical protein
VALPAIPDEEQEQRERIHFIQGRLKKQMPEVMAWHVGWTTFYGLGLLVQSGRAVIATSDAEVADNVVGSVKAAIGVVARLARAPDTIKGAHEMERLPEDTPEQRAHKLLVAERLLRRNAEECDRRYNLWAHGLNLALNIAGGLIIGLAYGDRDRALISAGVGIAVGELSIWSQPWRAKRDLTDYRRRFVTGLGRAPLPAATPARASVGLSPMAGRDYGGFMLGGSF